MQGRLQSRARCGHPPQPVSRLRKAAGDEKPGAAAHIFSTRRRARRTGETVSAEPAPQAPPAVLPISEVRGVCGRPLPGSALDGEPSPPTRPSRLCGPQPSQRAQDRSNRIVSVVAFDAQHLPVPEDPIDFGAGCESRRAMAMSKAARQGDAAVRSRMCHQAAVTVRRLRRACGGRATTRHCARPARWISLDSIAISRPRVPLTERRQRDGRPLQQLPAHGLGCKPQIVLARHRRRDGQGCHLAGQPRQLHPRPFHVRRREVLDGVRRVPHIVQDGTAYCETGSSGERAQQWQSRTGRGAPRREIVEIGPTSAHSDRNRCGAAPTAVTRFGKTRSARAATASTVTDSRDRCRAQARAAWAPRGRAVAARERGAGLPPVAGRGPFDRQHLPQVGPAAVAGRPAGMPGSAGRAAFHVRYSR